MKLILMIMLGLTGVIFLSTALLYFAEKKFGNLGFDNTLSIVSLIFSFAMILLMLYTIWSEIADVLFGDTLRGSLDQSRMSTKP